jgi:hypothetical protein
MGWLVYIRKGKVYIPSTAVAKSGICFDVEPIEVADITDSESLRRSVAAVINRGRPSVPDPPRDAYKNAPILALAGVKGWTTFYKGTRQLLFMRGDSGFEIAEFIPYGQGEQGFKPDESTRIKLPGNFSMPQIIERIVAEIQRSGAA